MTFESNISDDLKLAMLSDLWIGQTYWVHNKMNYKLIKYKVRRKFKKGTDINYAEYKEYLNIIIKEKRCYIKKQNYGN